MSFSKSFTALLTSSTVAIATAILPQPSQAQSISFRCIDDNAGIPTTYAVTPDGTKPVIKWKSRYFPDYPPMERCNEVTARFNNFNSKSMMQDLTTGWVNRHPVVCVTFSCSSDTVLFTLRPDQNPEQVLQELFANRQCASTPTIQSSGGAPTYNLAEYLRLTPVENPGKPVGTNPIPTPRPSSNSGGGVTW